MTTPTTPSSPVPSEPAMAAAREITDIPCLCLLVAGPLGRSDQIESAPEDRISAIIQRHFSASLASVQAERDALKSNLKVATDAYLEQHADLSQLRADLAEAQEQIDALKYWKESALAVEATWDCQAVGKLIDARPGSSIRPQIQPAIEKLRADLAAKGDRIKELEKQLLHMKPTTELSASDQLALLFPPMIRRDGANIQLSDLDEHYSGNSLPPRAVAERLIAERDFQP